MIFLEKQLFTALQIFCVINLNTYISLQNTLYKGQYNTLLKVAISNWETLLYYRSLTSQWVLTQPLFGIIYIYQKMNDFIGNLIKKDIARAKKIHETLQFIDNICALNDGRKFQKS